MLTKIRAFLLKTGFDQFLGFLIIAAKKKIWTAYYGEEFEMTLHSLIEDKEPESSDYLNLE